MNVNFKSQCGNLEAISVPAAKAGITSISQAMEFLFKNQMVICFTDRMQIVRAAIDNMHDSSHRPCQCKHDDANTFCTHQHAEELKLFSWDTRAKGIMVNLLFTRPHQQLTGKQLFPNMPRQYWSAAEASSDMAHVTGPGVDSVTAPSKFNTVAAKTKLALLMRHITYPPQTQSMMDKLLH